MKNEYSSENILRRTIDSIIAWVLVATEGSTSGARRTYLPTRIPDETIDHWGQLYRLNRLRQRGITFALFMRDPEGTFKALVYGEKNQMSDEFLPLLPAQVDASCRLEKQGI